jgi:hypothetical protein
VNDIPIKIITKSSGALGWEEKGLIAAIKKIGSGFGFLAAPIEKSDPLKKKGISRVSWLHFS